MNTWINGNEIFIWLKQQPPDKADQRKDGYRQLTPVNKLTKQNEVKSWRSEIALS